MLVGLVGLAAGIAAGAIVRAPIAHLLHYTDLGPIVVPLATLVRSWSYAATAVAGLIVLMEGDKWIRRPKSARRVGVAVIAFCGALALAAFFVGLPTLSVYTSPGKVWFGIISILSLGTSLGVCTFASKWLIRRGRWILEGRLLASMVTLVVIAVVSSASSLAYAVSLAASIRNSSVLDRERFSTDMPAGFAAADLSEAGGPAVADGLQRHLGRVATLYVPKAGGQVALDHEHAGKSGLLLAARTIADVRSVFPELSTSNLGWLEAGGALVFRGPSARILPDRMGQLVDFESGTALPEVMRLRDAHVDQSWGNSRQGVVLASALPPSATLQPQYVIFRGSPAAAAAVGGELLKDGVPTLALWTHREYDGAPWPKRMFFAMGVALCLAVLSLLVIQARVVRFGRRQQQLLRSLGAPAKVLLRLSGVLALTIAVAAAFSCVAGELIYGLLVRNSADFSVPVVYANDLFAALGLLFGLALIACTVSIARLRPTTAVLR
jgi:hypothetical protein